MALKEDWKQTGKALGHAFQGLGKSLVRTAKVGIEKADDWAHSEQPAAEAAAQPEAAPAEQPSDAAGTASDEKN